MKTIDQEITDIENFYKEATIEEAIAYFKSVSAKCFTTLKNAAKGIITYGRGRFNFKRKKTRSCLSPKVAHTVIPEEYDTIGANSPRDSFDFRYAHGMWRKVLLERHLNEIFRKFDSAIQDHIEMEVTLMQALEILIKK